MNCFRQPNSSLRRFCCGLLAGNGHFHSRFIAHTMVTLNGRYQENRREAGDSRNRVHHVSSHFTIKDHQRSSKISVVGYLIPFETILCNALFVVLGGSSTGGGFTPTGLRSPHSRPPKPESPSTPREDLMSQIKAKKRHGTWCFHGGRCQHTHKKLYNTIYIYLPAILENTGDIHTQRLDGKRA